MPCEMCEERKRMYDKERHDKKEAMKRNTYVLGELRELSLLLGKMSDKAYAASIYPCKVKDYPDERNKTR